LFPAKIFPSLRALIEISGHCNMLISRIIGGCSAVPTRSFGIWLLKNPFGYKGYHWSTFCNNMYVSCSPGKNSFKVKYSLSLHSITLNLKSTWQVSPLTFNSRWSLTNTNPNADLLLRDGNPFRIGKMGFFTKSPPCLVGLYSSTAHPLNRNELIL
jgi:hypothetical protein